MNSVDWSKAPEWAHAWAQNGDGVSIWLPKPPSGAQWVFVDRTWQLVTPHDAQIAPNFTYDGYPSQSMVLR